MRSSIQVSAALRRELEKRKQHPRASYEDVIRAALQAARPAPSLAHLPPKVGRVVQDFLADVRRLYGTRLLRVILYGSYARGEGRPESDVDILLVLEGPVDRGKEIERLVEITYEILLDRGLHISALPMALGDYLERATPLLLNVRREGIPL